MKLILIRGVPGTGKSTFAKRMKSIFQETNDEVSHFEADMYFEGEDGVYRFNPSQLGQAHSWCQRETKAMLKDGETVLVSNTFTTMKELKPYLDIAKELNCPVEIISLTHEYGSVHDVPEGTMQKMRERFDMLEGINYPHVVLS